MDPVELIAPGEDTTYGLIREHQARGDAVWAVQAASLRLLDGVLSMAAAPLAKGVAPEALRAEAEQPLGLDALDVIWVRKDPPFDAGYLWLTLLLEHARGKVLVVNDPQGLRNANEKLFACRVPELMPTTTVCARRGDIDAFVREVGGAAVLKPIDGFAGGGIFLLRPEDPNYASLIETQTAEGRRAVMLQRYLPEVAQGDKRILLAGGEPVGAIWRVPQGGDLRSNIHVGGRVALAELDEADRRICTRLKPLLAEEGLFFVGLDVIGGKLTEVNVTSPTGLRQMSDLSGQSPAVRVLEALDSLWAASGLAT